MNKNIIKTENAPGAIGPYSQAVIVDKLIYTSGQIPINPKNALIPDGIEEQTKQSLENVKAILEAAGSGMNKVIKATVFLKDMNDFAVMNSIYQEYFVDEYPARSAVQVARLPKDVLIEIEVIAQL